MTLLTLLAIPSFVAFCLLAIIHTLQTMSLRLAESAPFPSEAVLQEYFPAAPALRTAHAVTTRVRTYERVLQNYASRPSRSFSRESNSPAFLPLPVPASFLRAYRRNWPDSSFRIMAVPDAMYRSSATRDFSPRRRTRLSALTRRPRSLSTASLSYSYS